MTRDKKYLDMMNQWFILKQEGKSIGKYLDERGYYQVAIYGMGVYGRHVIRELQGTNVAVKYGIDQKKMEPYEGIEILQPIGNLPYVQAIINTVIDSHMEIKNFLTQITNVSVLCLEDIVFESYDCK